MLGDDSNEQKLAKIEAWGSDRGLDLQATVPLFANLLSVPFEHRYGALELTPQQLRYRTIEVLVALTLSMAQQGPVFVLIEDAHWIDPSMTEFVGALMQKASDQPILIAVTMRPDGAMPWPIHPNVTSINLNRLGRLDAMTIAREVGGQELTEVIAERIVSRADGVPLFVEELTKSIIESLKTDSGPALDALIPATLQSLLIARLDRLDEARTIAQCGAAIGREFLLSATCVCCGDRSGAARQGTKPTRRIRSRLSARRCAQCCLCVQARVDSGCCVRDLAF